MALRRVKGTLERALDKDLQDLVRGIRNHKDDQAKYINECIEEIKLELKVDNMASKANAINKLVYLQMFGYDISWASFNIIEVMSSPKFTHKRIGYLAASQCFHEGTDVLMLSTNLIRKELNSPNTYDAGVAMSGLACFMTPDLARDLTNDIMNLMSSTKPYLRKKAVLLMYKVFLKFPEALRPAFPRLKEKLEDPDYGVQAAAVNVICELARKNPQNYLSLAPLLFKLLTTSSNNWVLIKIIKLFGAMTPLEPRLGKKLIEPLTNLIHSTSAMSLLYECITTVIAVLISISSGIPNHAASIQLCVQKLRILIEDSDQNLKYLGLLAMGNILKTHPKSVQAHKDLILQCLDDKDESIRLRALDLLYGMISRKTLMEIVKKLMVHMDKAEGSHYRDELLSKIIEICSQNNYQFIVNFEWYVSVLIELTRIEGSKNGQLIASQMLDVAIRVQTVRPFCVKQMAELLENCQAILTRSKINSMSDIMYAAAWICGEYAEHLDDPEATLSSMLNSSVLSLPCNIQGVLVQNVLKLYVHIVTKTQPENRVSYVMDFTERIMDKLAMFVHSADLEVQERAVSIHQLLRHVIKLQKKSSSDSIRPLAMELGPLFAGELNPVAPKAQRKVKVPEGLDLDAWINEPPKAQWSSDESDDKADIAEDPLDESKSGKRRRPKKKQHRSKRRGNKELDGSPIGIFGQEVKTVTKMPEPTTEELKVMRDSRLKEQELNPHYLKPSGGGKISTIFENDSDLPPIQKLPSGDVQRIVKTETTPSKSLVEALISNSSTSRLSDKYLMEHQQLAKKHDGKSRKKKKPEQDDDDDLAAPPVAVSKNFDMPEDADLSDEDSAKKPGFAPEDPHRFLNINLDIPVPVKKSEGKSQRKSSKKKETESDKKEGKRSKKSASKKSAGNEETVQSSPPPKSSKKKRKENSIEKSSSPAALPSELLTAPPAEAQHDDVPRKSADVIPSLDDDFWLSASAAETSKAPVVSSTKRAPTEEKAAPSQPTSSITTQKISTGILSKLIAPPPTCTGDQLMKAITSGQLPHSHETKVKSEQLVFSFTKGHSIHDVVQFLIQSANLSVVEKADDCASLYGKTDKNQPIYLLLKRLKNDSLSIESKSSNEKVASNAVKAVRKLVKNDGPQ